MTSRPPGADVLRTGEAAEGGAPRRRATAVLYVGGFLGPYAATLSAAVLPEIGDSFAVGSQTATHAVTAYLVPFAVLMLVSGAVGGRLGLRRTSSTAYALLILTSAGAALSQGWHTFLAFQALSGALNAFTTPLLIAMLASLTPPARLGRTLGIFAAWQSLGVLSGPLASGLLATFSWRLAYIPVAVSAVVILVVGLPATRSAAAPWRSLFGYLLHPWTIAIAGAVFLIGLASTGLIPIVVLYSVDRWALDATDRGLLVMCGGVAAFAVSAPAGRLLDRSGPRWIAASSLGVAAVALLLSSRADSAWMFAFGWFIIVGAAQVAIVVLMAVLMARPGAGSAISMFQAARFGGVAAGAVVFVPVYDRSFEWAFALGGAIITLALVVTLVTTRPRHRIG